MQTTKSLMACTKRKHCRSCCLSLLCGQQAPTCNKKSGSKNTRVTCGNGEKKALAYSDSAPPRNQKVYETPSRGFYWRALPWRTEVQVRLKHCQYDTLTYLGVQRPRTARRLLIKPMGHSYIVFGARYIEACSGVKEHVVPSANATDVLRTGWMTTKEYSPVSPCHSPVPRGTMAPYS